MSCGTFICGAMGKTLPTLLKLRRDPDMLRKTAEKHGISIELAEYYLKAEIKAKEAGL